MGRTVSMKSTGSTKDKAKALHHEALCELARPLKWSQFVSRFTDEPVSVTRQAHKITIRYGFFLKITGIGVFVNDIMIRFIPCACPVRTNLRSILNGGGHYLVPADILYKDNKEYQYKSGMIHKTLDSSEPILKAWLSIMGPI